MDLKAVWKQHYAGTPQQLQGLSAVRGVASVFNANIDAVLKVQPQALLDWRLKAGVDHEPALTPGPKRIDQPGDLLRGLLECFSQGIAQEWLVGNEECFHWMRDTLGYDRLQMGGQGGIIANVLAVAGAQAVYAHCASLPSQQAELFLGLKQLQSTDALGQMHPAAGIDRPGDLPLIHWILEFDKGAEITVAGQRFVCPKSNRFIATYDPLNFELAVDPGFDSALRKPELPLDFILLSGYQLLRDPLPGQPEGSGLRRIYDSWQQVAAWKAAHPAALIHFEFASTQDLKIRKGLVDRVAPHADSIGCNEQEEIGILEVLGETALAKEAEAMDSVSLFKGLLAIFKKTAVPRIQLHMFGLYVTLLKPGNNGGPKAFDPEANRAGMAFAATVAAAKAGTGSIEDARNLLWAHGKEVAEHSLKELSALDAHIAQTHGVSGLAQSGIAACDGFTVVAVPTILIDKPVTLVGMGDTISSLSLLGAR